jgi:chromosome segregation ATPase
LSVEFEFKAMKALFQTWAESGVPAGIRYPKTQSDAVGWSCEQFGIKGVGSKRDFKTTSPTYGPIVKEIRALIAKLKPVDELRKLRRETGDAASAIKPKKRVYRTQKARRVAAENDTAHFRAMLGNTLTQLHETRQTLGTLERDLKVERQLTAELKRENAKLEGDNAQLKQMLAARSGVLQLVD